MELGTQKTAASVKKTAKEEKQMSYWSHNPELLDEITTEALPEEWREKVESGEIELIEVPVEIRDKAMLEGEKEYWAGRIDEVKTQLKERGFPDPAKEEHEEGPFETLKRD